MADPFMGNNTGFLPPPPLVSTTGAAVADATVMPIIIAMMTDGRDGYSDLDGVNEVAFATRAGSVYTAIRIPLPSDMIVRAGVELKLLGFAGPWCSGDLAVDGSMHDDGNSSTGQAGGTARAAGTFAANLAGGAGGALSSAGVAGSASTVEGPTGGRFGGTAGAPSVGAAGASATLTQLSVTRGTTHAMAAAHGAGQYWTNLGVSAESTGVSGSGGGGGIAGVGGGGGASGGFLHFCARTVTVGATGRISANGGNGGPGAATDGGPGSGGAGGIVRYYAGTWTGADAQAYGGQGGARGGSTIVHGNCGMQGIVINLAPTRTPAYRVALSASEYGAAIASGILDISGRCVAGGDSGQGAGGVAAVGSSTVFFKLTTADGEASLRFDPTNFRLDLRVRNVIVLSTAAINSTAAAGPTMQPWRTGDRIEWRAWFNPAGGARSMGIRFFVNRCGGLDTTGAGSGAALATASAGEARGSSATAWNLADTYVTGSRAAEVVGRICILGDSISAVRSNSTGYDGVSIGSRLGLTSGCAISLAVQGAATDSGGGNQTAAWTASVMRGNAACVGVVITVGQNDLSGGSTAAAQAARIQTLVNDINANNAAAAKILCQLTPTSMTAAQEPVYVDARANYAGTGPNPVTGVTFVVAHVARMGDANLNLRQRAESNDFSNPNFIGRSFHAAAAAAGLVAAGVTP